MRAEYQRLVDELPGLARALGERLPPDAVRDAATLVAAVDCLDRVLDAEDDRGRAALRRATVAALRGERATDGELAARLSELRHVLVANAIVEPFIALGIAALANTERMRRTRSIRDYIAFARREGVLFVDLTLLVLGTRAGPVLARFLYAVSGPANLWDKLRDARADHRSGELAIRPGLAVHVRIAATLVAGIPATIRAHRRPVALARWAARWLW